MKNKVIKDGNGNIVIPENLFQNLIIYIEKSTEEGLENEDWDFIYECKKILHQKYIFKTSEDGYYLCKKYEHQDEDIPWSGNDVNLVYSLFKDTRIIYEETRDLLPLDGSEDIMSDTKPIGKTKDGWIAVEPEPSPWLIERPLRYDYEYLSISENGLKNRPWKTEEIENITKLFNDKQI